MDYLRVLLVPFHATNLMLVGIFAASGHPLPEAGYFGLFGVLFLQIWMLKYCYVLIEHLADGASEPPVMDTEMLSPFETRPWIQVALLFGVPRCVIDRRHRRHRARRSVLVLFPAIVAILGFGERRGRPSTP